MSNETFISFYLQTFRIHVFNKAIIQIGNPKYIRFRVHKDGQSILMEAYDKRNFHSHRVPKKRVEKGGMEINSMPLCRLLINRFGWDKDQSYRIPGKTYPQQKVAVFDLTAAERIKK